MSENEGKSNGATMMTLELDQEGVQKMYANAQEMQETNRTLRSQINQYNEVLARAQQTANLLVQERNVARQHVGLAVSAIRNTATDEISPGLAAWLKDAEAAITSWEVPK